LLNSPVCLSKNDERLGNAVSDIVSEGERTEQRVTSSANTELEEA